MSTKTRLIVKDADGKRVIPITADETVTVGRTANNTVPIKDNASSRTHCQVAYQGDGWYVQDLGSRNGTQVNKENITGIRRLDDGDVIQIGKARLMFKTGAASQSEPNLKVVDRSAPAQDNPLTFDDPVTEQVRVDRSQLSGGEEGEAVVLDGLDERYWLVHFVGDSERSYGISSARTTVGRAESNAITIRGDDASSCSSKHAELTVSDGKFMLADLGSTNGTKVNGIKIEKHTIKAGDIIEFGRAQFLLKSESLGEGAIDAFRTDEAATGDVLTGAAVATADASGTVAFLLPFVGTLALFSLLIGGLALWANRGTVQPPPTVPVVPGNQVLAYSFEDVVSNRPVGWAGDADGVSVVAGNAKSGDKVLAISQASAAAEMPVKAVTYDLKIAVKGGLAYRVQGHVRHAKGPGYAALRLRWLSESDPEFQMDDYTPLLAPDGNSWRKVSEVLEAPEGADHVQVACVVVGQVEGAHFDDVTLVLSEKQVADLPHLGTPLGRVDIDRAGGIHVRRGKREPVLEGLHLLIKDADNRVLYDQKLMEIDGEPQSGEDGLRYSGSIAPLRGGDRLSLAIAITGTPDGVAVRYTFQGKVPGATAHLVASTRDLDANGPMAIESRGEFRKLRGQFLAEEASLLRWKGEQRHLGMYVSPPGYLAYGVDPQPTLELFRPVTKLKRKDGTTALGFRLRLDFNEDSSAMKAAFEAAAQLRSQGKVGQAYRKLKDILQSYPFIEGVGEAHVTIKALVTEAEDAWRVLAAEFDRAHHFGRPDELAAVVELVDAYRAKYAGMEAGKKAAALSRRVVDAYKEAKAESDEEAAAAIMMRAADFKEVGMTALARMAYARVVDRYKKTPQAKEAAKALEELK